MDLPFSTAQFFAVFSRYNEALWPAPLLAYALGVAALLAAWRPGGANRIAWLILGLFWLANGILYHWGFFSAINPAAHLFGALFVLQALLLLWQGIRRDSPPLALAATPAALAGALMILYALALYPLAGWAAGHHYPAVPLFGLAPCPTTIFTLGLLLWTQRPPPWYLALIPLAWALVGGSAAVLLQVPQDYGLPAAALLALLLLRRRPSSG